MASRSSSKFLTLENMNPRVKKMDYGIVSFRAKEIEKEIARGAKKPFPNIIMANVGDAHRMNQLPVTFIRQVAAACTYPELIDTSIFPSDVNRRAKELLALCGGGSIGAYSFTIGIEGIRDHVADFIRDRDGIASNPNEIILSAGATDAIQSFMKLFNCVSPDGEPPGVMIPIPQYPIYTASIAEFGMYQIEYYLDEDKNWSLDIPELKRAISAARPHCNPRVLCVINPGNPTGQVLSRQNIEDIIIFAKEERLFLFADEVYQDNVYDPTCRFHSFKKVMTEMGPPYSQMELASFHSASKGYVGECGFRCGYVELVNVDPVVVAQFKKSIAAKLCPSIIGQIVLDCVVNPPKPGDPSYPLFSEEKEKILEKLAGKATRVHEAFESLEGIECNPIQGAMYAFPRLSLPEKAIEKAKALKIEPDTFYAGELLENTGINIVAGSAFGQKEGTYHFRTTILPPPEIFHDMLDRFKKFHLEFLKEYQ